MDAHKALIQDIFNNGTLIEVPFFSGLMYGRMTYGSVC